MPPSAVTIRKSKSKTEIFEEPSPKYFYDVSSDAAIKFLNSKGFNITTLEEMIDDMVKSLYETGFDLLKFARANGIHNKSLPKVSPDKEKFLDKPNSIQIDSEELKSI